MKTFNIHISTTNSNKLGQHRNTKQPVQLGERIKPVKSKVGNRLKHTSTHISAGVASIQWKLIGTYHELNDVASKLINNIKKLESV